MCPFSSSPRFSSSSSKMSPTKLFSSFFFLYVFALLFTQEASSSRLFPSWERNNEVAPNRGEEAAYRPRSLPKRSNLNFVRSRLQQSIPNIEVRQRLCGRQLFQISRHVCNMLEAAGGGGRRKRQAWQEGYDWGNTEGDESYDVGQENRLNEGNSLLRDRFKYISGLRRFVKRDGEDMTLSDRCCEETCTLVELAHYFC